MACTVNNFSSVHKTRGCVPSLTVPEFFWADWFSRTGQNNVRCGSNIYKEIIDIVTVEAIYFVSNTEYSLHHSCDIDKM